nr:hypothetical protein [Candidatus Sigynarchaeota archaeon]
AFLASSGGVSDVLAELVNICEEKDRWPQILKGEIDRCKSVSESYPSLKNREVEQVVVAVFLHSQPKGQKAETPDLLELIVHPGIDLTAFNDALQRWRDLSWFLKDIPSYWMLVTSPNMTSLHLRSINRIKPEEIDGELSKRIRDIKNLKKTDEDVVLHLLPKSNTDINDSAELHYVILNQEYAVDLEAGIVPDLFKDLFNRVYKNSIVALVPEKNQLNRIKGMIREYLAWISIGTGNDFDLLEEFQKTELKRRCDQADKNIAEGIVNLYEILVTLGENGEILSIKLPYSSTTPFEKIKKALVEQDRMLVTTLDLALLLPGSHYEIWGKEERRKSVRDLVFSFGQYTRLPKVLNSTAIFDTLENAVTSGSLVLEITRPDKTKQQFWKSRPKIQDLNKKEAEIV